MTSEATHRSLFLEQPSPQWGEGEGKWHFPTCLLCYQNLGGTGRVGSAGTRYLLTMVLNGLIQDLRNSTFRVYQACKC